MLLAHTYNNLRNQQKKRKGRFSRSRAVLSPNSEDSGTEDLYAGYTGSTSSLDNLSKYVGPCDQSSDDLDDFFPAHLAMCDKTDDDDGKESDNMKEEIEKMSMKEEAEKMSCAGSSPHDDEFINIPTPETEVKGFPHRGSRSSSREFPTHEDFMAQQREDLMIGQDEDDDVFEDFFFDSVQESTSMSSELFGSVDASDTLSIVSL